MRNTFGTTKASVGSSIVFDIFSQNRVGKDSEQGSANKGRDSLLSGAKGIEEIDTAKLPDTNPTEL